MSFSSLKTDNLFPFKTLDMFELGYRLDSIIAKKLAHSLPSGSPIIIHMIGIPGSGKSTIAKALFKELSENTNEVFSFLGFDQIMSEIEDYKNSNNPVDAFKKFEIPARNAGYKLLEQFLNKRVSILFDHSGANEKHVDLLRFCAHVLDYKVIVIHVFCDLDLAKTRIINRTQIKGRHTPEHYVDERNIVLENVISKYRDIANLFLMFHSTPDNETGIDELGNSILKFINKKSD